MAVDEKEDFKGRRKRITKNAHQEANNRSELWNPSFPVNITVDELHLYRKKKHNFAWLQDNLKIEDGSFKFLKTEYTRRFKNFYEILKSSLANEKDLVVEVIKSKDTLKLEGAQEHRSEYNECFNTHEITRPNDTSRDIMNEVVDNEIYNRSHPLGSIFDDVKLERTLPRLLKRSTNLKTEGDFSHITEYTDKFIEYLLARRSELCRTPTTLKLGTGEMESKTETTDQFRKFDDAERPSLIRKFTNLHLEGDLDIRSEKQDKFQRYDAPIRPPFAKKLTNLRLEGDYFLIPEYRYQYVQYENVERPVPFLPTNNLKSAVLFETSDTQTNTHGRSSPLIPFLRESRSYHGFDESAKLKINASSSLRQSTTSIHRTSSHPNLTRSAVAGEKELRKHSTPHSPHKNAYLDFDAGANRSVERKETKRTNWANKDYPRSKILTEPESRNTFGGIPRDRFQPRRWGDNLDAVGKANNVTTFDKTKDRIVEHKTSMKEAKQIFESSNEDIFETEQLVNERFECLPEYRKAALDYLIREKIPPGQRRRILEIPDITINNADDQNSHGTSSPTEKPEPNDATSVEEAISRTAAQKPPLSTKTSIKVSNRQSLSNSPTSRHSSKIITETVTLSPGKKKRVFRRTSTPSPVRSNQIQTSSRNVSPNTNMSVSLPKLTGNWGKSEAKPPNLVETDIWSSTETDPAFVVVNDRNPSRRSARHNLYKEQRWMPSWHSGGS